MRKLVLIVPAAAMFVANPASAETISFTGAVVNLCVLAVSTPGVLGLVSGGTTLSSEGTGGLPATLTVSATGSNPTLAFGAPSMTGPSASTTNAVKQIAYSSPGGANQAYTSTTSSYAMTKLIDTIAIKGKATNSDGWVSGSYGIAATVTCQQ